MWLRRLLFGERGGKEASHLDDAVERNVEAAKEAGRTALRHVVEMEGGRAELKRAQRELSGIAAANEVMEITRKRDAS
jgi:hypothetical protein